MHTESSKPKKNIWLVPILIILVGGIAFSAYKLASLFLEYHKAAAEFSAMSEEFVTHDDTEETTGIQISKPFYERQSTSNPVEDEEDPEFQYVDMTVDFNVLFDRMWQTNPDVVAWINSPNTVIDYPVLHGPTNDTYLHANWKGSYSISGSIFTNYQHSGYLVDDYNTIIYGHNMKDGSMFHSIKSYANQSYYEEHPYLWYVTPDANYILYVVGAFVASVGYEGYYPVESVDDVQSLLHGAVGYSDIEADYVIDGLTRDEIIENAKHMVVLSTCSYEFTNARYVIVAVPLLTNDKTS